MKRIFYYSGYRLTIFHWKNEKCIASFTFDPSDKGIEKYKMYLNATENTPVRFLIDLIEEDFNKENIPHVGPTDRKAIVSRLIDRQYRKSKDYVYYNVIGRETTGRKDDIVLYSVLSNPEILEPWLIPIKEHNISVSGIWSLPLLSEDLFLKLQKKDNNILLVSQQVPSNLRQTFIKNGKFESSRSAVVNLDDATIGEYISIEIEQTIRFLSNQRQIGFDEKIQIHIICREEDLNEIQMRCTDTAMRAFHYYHISDIQQLLGCKILSDEKSDYYSNSLYSYICASKILPKGHYGPNSLFKKYYDQIFSTMLYSISILLIIFSFIFSLVNYTEAISLKNETLTLKHQTESINRAYESTLAKFETKLSRAQMMKSSVLLAEKIHKQAHISPQHFMTSISRIFSKYQIFNTEITKISWQQHQSNDLPKNNVKKKMIIDYAKPDIINQHATIGGYIHVSKSSLKQSVDKVNSIANALKNNKSIKHVKIKRSPVDARSISSIENETGSDQKNNKNSDKNKGQFEIELLMLGKES
ncbi:hypothetical protein MNBD_GAMMA07-2365 [hydrothermal vent metagenome]|uniref:Uncharacterized protein n=1 Tax=hydrothermal vent metagenome TaxID=652676 RepID=A0A3B0WYD5_9ZZZZ